MTLDELIVEVTTRPRVEPVNSYSWKSAFNNLVLRERSTRADLQTAIEMWGEKDDRTVAFLHIWDEAKERVRKLVNK